MKNKDHNTTDHDPPLQQKLNDNYAQMLRYRQSLHSLPDSQQEPAADDGPAAADSPDETYTESWGGQAI